MLFFVHFLFVFLYYFPTNTLAASKKSTASAASTKSKSRATKTVEQEMSQEEIEERASEFLSTADILPQMVDSNWKTRLVAVETYQSEVKRVEVGSVPAQVLIGVLNRKPGFKDTNIQVLKLKLETLKNIIETHGITK